AIKEAYRAVNELLYQTKDGQPLA
ncbi:uncharacterized protein METZ01_LOCUS350728, partial [marine metagenome]